MPIGVPMGFPLGFPMGVPLEAPAARAAPRGLAGLVDRNQPAPYELLDTSKFPPNFVLLNVYDIGDANIFQRINAVSTVGDNVLIGGIYHAGVQIYGNEWSFGFTDEDDTGVFNVLPRMATQHTYRVTCPMGITQFSEREVMGLIEVLKDMWPGLEYNLIHRNCLDFASAFCTELGVGRIPGWVDRFGRTASSIDKMWTKVGTGVNQTRQLVGNAAQTVGADVGGKLGKLRGVGEEARQRVDGMRREAPKIAEAAQSGAQAIGSNVKNWGKGLITAARALSEDQGRDRRGNSLKNSLRNRGGLQEFLARGSLHPGASDDASPHAFSPPSRRSSYTATSSNDAFLLEGLSDHESDEVLEVGAAVEEDDAMAQPTEALVTDSQADATLPVAELVLHDDAATSASNEDILASEGSQAALLKVGSAATIEPASHGAAAVDRGALEILPVSLVDDPETVTITDHPTA